jgi:hypothetical protein
MLGERGVPGELLAAGGLPPVQPAIPETVRALVAARLDGLPAAEKAVRAERHRRAAAWLEGLPAAVPPALLTRHRLRAVALARMTGAADAELEARIRLDLREHHRAGRWDQAVAVADAVLGEPEARGHHGLELPARVCRGRILLARGQEAAALAEAEAVLVLAATMTAGDLPDLDPARAFAARALLAAGRPGEARAVVDELLAGLAGQQAELGPDLAAVLAALGHGPEVLGHGRGAIGSTPA